jgi:hypothetical protein
VLTRLLDGVEIDLLATWHTGSQHAEHVNPLLFEQRSLEAIRYERRLARRVMI